MVHIPWAGSRYLDEEHQNHFCARNFYTTPFPVRSRPQLFSCSDTVEHPWSLSTFCVTLGSVLANRVWAKDKCLQKSLLQLMLYFLNVKQTDKAYRTSTLASAQQTQNTSGMQAMLYKLHWNVAIVY